jgi:hypothetical protein
MNRYLYCDVSPEPIAVATAQRAASQPHAGTGSQYMTVWTNDDLEKLHIPGLISVVDQIGDERPTPSRATGDVNLDEGEIHITAENGIEIIEVYMNEMLTELNVLEDLARRHDISFALCAATDVPTHS